VVRGAVQTFDAQRGDGTIVSDDGEVLYFHCVTIADGSRQIELGTRVRARRAVGRLGGDEAVDVERDLR
jgi:cold shock CspA family protein